MFEELLSPSALSALFQVLMIDLVLAGGQPHGHGVVAGGLPPEQRRKAIFWGLVAAVITRIGFALITTQLLGIIGLLFAGGVLLLWVCWKMWRELRDQAVAGEVAAEAALDADPATEPKVKPKTFKDALIQILIADVSMSLDNVLAVAGAAREHPTILVFGLIMSIALMGVAAHAIARLLHKYRWIGYIGLLIVLYVALHMMWQGGRDVVDDLGWTAQYNAAVPDFMDIQPKVPAPAPAH